MQIRAQLVYTDIFTQRPAATVSGDTLSFPVMQVGKQYPIALRHIERVDGKAREAFPKVRKIIATVGFDDLRPVSGGTKLMVGAGPSVDGVNTTLELDRDISGPDFEARLNELSGIVPHDFSVRLVDGSYRIRRASGANFTLTAIDNTFKPISFVEQYAKEDEEGWVREVRFTQSPLAFSDSGSAIMPPKPYFEPVTDGVDYGNGLTQNEVQNLIRPALFRGEFYIKYRKTEAAPWRRTELFDRADGPAQYKAGLDALLAADGGFVTATVGSEPGKLRCEFGGDLSGVDLPLLGVEVPALGAPPGDYTFILDLDTDEARSAVRNLKKGETLPVPFDLSMIVPEDESDDESPDKERPLWRVDLKLCRPLNKPGMATAQPIAWLRRPNPQTNLPYNSTQVTFGQGAYESLPFGDDAQTDFSFDHDLESPGLTGRVIYDQATGRILRDSEYEMYSTNGGNTLEVAFEVPPPATGYKLLMATPQKIEAFINDLQIAMEQVTDLPETIASLGSRLYTLEQVAAIGALTVKDPTAAPYEIKLPPVSEVAFYAGAEKPESLFGENGVDLAKLSAGNQAPPPLLAALHSATVEEFPEGDYPDPATDEGTVFENEGDEDIEIYADRGIPGDKIAPGEFAVCDANAVWAADLDGSESTSFYPRAFTRTPYRFAVNDKQFTLGKKLTLTGAFQAQLVNSPCWAQWVLTVELGTILAESAPSPIGLNLQKVSWAAVPALFHRVTIRELVELHSFGVQVASAFEDDAEVFTVRKMLYGEWSSVSDESFAVPTSRNLAMRVRLGRWDIENGFPDARGWLAWRMLAASGLGGDLKVTIA